ncbi:MAG: N-acetyl sugar amidotransferase [Alphaproteobacteria bacterium]|nr:N-acetyl sugar amidotransferase [Alphaproteobacteria bacterium]
MTEQTSITDDDKGHRIVNNPDGILEWPYRPPKVQYCKRCVYPSSSAVPLTFDEHGICSGCRVSEAKPEIDWRERGEMLKEILEEYRSQDGSNYDCIIPVSGGKDSYYQTHVIRNVYGLNPLLVTYHGNNYTPTGLRNLENMREVFGVDHIFFTPSIDVLKKLNRIAFALMGDMNWHAHGGIFTYPVRVAVQQRIPLIVWGEHGYTDVGGMYSMDDFPEMTRKYRTEHGMRGYDWYDMVGREDLTPQDLLWLRYPSDEELEDVGVRGIYLGFYVPWDANEHFELVTREYGFQVPDEPFDRTYRRFSNLDDMHENGLHDYMKFVKFGYGRCSDHVSKDIRAGKLSRDDGVELVRKHDSVKPSDLKRWLDYVGMSEEKFDAIADSFRDSRVWWRGKHGNWVKDNIWD